MRTQTIVLIKSVRLIIVWLKDILDKNGRSENSLVIALMCKLLELILCWITKGDDARMYQRIKYIGHNMFYDKIIYLHVPT